MWIIPFEGGAPKKLGEGRMPAVSKDGDVAFVRNGQIWLTNLNGEKPAEVVHAKGRSTDLRWSPDGTTLAFVNNRAEHAFIGVFQNRRINRSSYLDPSASIATAAPVWSTDSRRVAFIRTAERERAPEERGPQREAAARRGRSASPTLQHRARAAKSGMPIKGPGSVFHAMVAADQLYWADGDRLVFAWEKTAGCISIRYRPKADRRSCSHPAISKSNTFRSRANRRDLLFSSNQDDIDRRHIWRVAVAGADAAGSVRSEAGRRHRMGTGGCWATARVAYFRSSAERDRTRGRQVGGRRADRSGARFDPRGFSGQASWWSRSR